MLMGRGGLGSCEAGSRGGAASSFSMVQWNLLCKGEAVLRGGGSLRRGGLDRHDCTGQTVVG